MPHIVSMDHIGLSSIRSKMELLNPRKEKEKTVERAKQIKKGVQSQITMSNSKSGSGCSNHMTDGKEWLADFDKSKKSKLASIPKLRLGNGFL